MQNIQNMKQYAIMGGMFETISRYGSAGAEFLKGLRGIDHETGKIFDRSLKKISTGKINPQFFDNNIKQQAGYSAEVVSVSRRNARAIIDRSDSRFLRSEDIAKYGKNNNVVDIVELIDGKEITSQMKFVTNQESLLRKIACGEGGGKTDLSRYLTADKIEVPKEQVENMKNICQKKAQSLREQAARAKQDGKIELAYKKLRQAENYEKLEGKIADSALTTEEAIHYRLNPRLETVKDIAGVSHEAGLQGAKFGAAIGGGISAISNVIAACSGDKTFTEAVIDSTQDTLVSAGVGYSTAFAGTAIKTYMQQSGSVITRNLSKTGLPAAIVSVCLATGKSIKKYAQGEISEGELAEEMALTASGMLSASMFTVLGQLAVPIPVLGGMIGGMVGYAVTNTFYQSFCEVIREQKLSAERLQMLEIKCTAAKAIAETYRQSLEELFTQKLAQLDDESQQLFAVLNRDDLSVEDFCNGMNHFAEVLGKKLSISSMAELDKAMLSDNPLTI